VTILAFDASARTASAALCRDGTLLGQAFQNSGLTHSQTLMPMLQALLQNTQTDAKTVGLVAVTRGPGSFTGLRVGVSTAAGLAWGWGVPCCGVSALEAAALGVVHMGGLIAAVMDARRGQIYNALFQAEGDALIRLTPDRALSAAALWAEIQKKDPVLVGDGAELCYNLRGDRPARLAPVLLRHPTAWAVALRAELAAARGEICTPEELTPVYLRLPQAERERLEAAQAAKDAN
jgi:tRNA threonylcarbamoyladenosine biosynthesis protein TsaB